MTVRFALCSTAMSVASDQKALSVAAAFVTSEDVPSVEAYDRAYPLGAAPAFGMARIVPRLAPAMVCVKPPRG